MTSMTPTLQTFVPDIYSETVLKDLAQGFIEQSLKDVDTQKKIIRKVVVIVEKSLFQKEEIEKKEKFCCYIIPKVESEHGWNKPPDNIPAPETLDVAPDILPYLQSQWANISQLSRPFLDQQKDAYNQFLSHQQQEVGASISEDLKACWLRLAEEIEKFKQHGPLVYVQGKIKLSIHTVDRENENIESLKNYETNFQIGDAKTFEKKK